jgi:uncharacterized delta-60 repeat protein
MDMPRNAPVLPRQLQRVAAAIAATAALAGATGVAHAAPGALDPTFGSGGMVLADPGSVSFQGLAVQPDGKVLALDAGHDSQSYERVLRFLPDGAPDPSFGTGGAAEPVASPAFWTRALALQPDGKIVVAGYDSAYDYVVARLLPDGKLDPDFDGDSGTANGVVHTTLTAGNDMPSAVQVDTQGRIVVAGNANGDVGIVRYLPNGKLDKAFAGDGTMVDPTPAAENVAALATVDDGIVVAGSITSNTFVARYTDAGSPASGFGQSGRTIVDADPAHSDAADSLAVQSDGTILMGVATWGAITDPPDRVVALTPGGSLDMAFANGGNTPVQIAVNAIALTSDDKIAVAGWSLLDDDDAFAVQRLEADATADTTFAGGGPALTRPPNAYAIADKVAVAPDGKLVLGGAAYDNGSGAQHVAIARYQGAPDPAVDPSSGGSAPATPSVAQQPDPLTLWGVTVTHRTFSVDRGTTGTVGSAQAARAAKRGTAFVFKLNRAATVTIRIKRLHHARAIVKLKRASRAGTNRARFTGRVARHTLRPGRYRATLTATDATGSHSNARAVTFRIVANRRK